MVLEFRGCVFLRFLLSVRQKLAQSFRFVPLDLSLRFRLARVSLKKNTQKT